MVVGIDVPGPLWRPDRGVEAERGEIEAERGRWIVDAATLVGFDLRVLRGQARLHNR
jgi:hypothetical protein